MIKNYLKGLCFVILASCSTTNDDLKNIDESKNMNLSAKGFRGDTGSTTDDELPSNGIWVKSSFPPNPIYGFYSDHTKKHLYSKHASPKMLPRTQPGLYYNFLERFLGSADGTGNEITAWFNRNNEDLVLTTNPAELNGQNGWEKNEDIGKSYNEDDPGSFPIYRYYRGKTSSHFYTRDRNELGNGNFGFVYEGIAFYLKDSAPNDYRLRDGQRLKDKNTGYLYIVFESRLRILETMEVANRVFNAQNGEYFLSVNIDDYIGPRGKILNADAKLVEDTTSGKMYFVDNGLLRYIPNLQILNVYGFKKDAIVKTNNIIGFTGKDVTKTY